MCGANDDRTVTCVARDIMLFPCVLAGDGGKLGLQTCEELTTRSLEYNSINILSRKRHRHQGLSSAIQKQLYTLPAFIRCILSLNNAKCSNCGLFDGKWVRKLCIVNLFKVLLSLDLT